MKNHLTTMKYREQCHGSRHLYTYLWHPPPREQAGPQIFPDISKSAMKGVAILMKTNTTVRMFGALHTIRRERGLQSTTEVHIPDEGCAAYDLAGQLDLPLEKIEAVFVNHKVYSLDQRIQAGDRVAFVPTGIPGPSRFLLGISEAGRRSCQGVYS